MEEIKIRVWDKDPMHIEGNGLPVVPVDVREIHLVPKKMEGPSLVLVLGRPGVPHTLYNCTTIEVLNKALAKLGYVITCPPKHLVRHTEYVEGVRSRVSSEHLHDTEQEAKDATNSYNLGCNKNDKVPEFYIIAEYVGEVPGTYKVFKHVPEGV